MLNILKKYGLIVIGIAAVTSLSPRRAIAQKVGVVLSGGGASGLAHIGFLRALEENEIPIDYIAGTSMGALVGGLYAAGYSPDEIEAIFNSKEFKLWASGKIDEQYTHYFKKIHNDASWVRLKFTLDSLLEMNLPTNLINSTSLDFGLANILAGANANCGGNFDSLFIPFRCVAADIKSKKAIPFGRGNLATVIRASISYPFFLNPVNIEGQLLYDGGLYDNFPVSTLCNSFQPDYIIGCNVSYNFPEPSEDNLLSQVRSMMSYETTYEINCEKGFIINPSISEAGLLDFSQNEAIISQGYKSTREKIDSIRMYLERIADRDDLAEKRQEFKRRMPKTVLSKIEFTGLNRAEEKYMKRFIRFRPEDSLTFVQMVSKVMKLASDEKILRIFPELIYVPETRSFTMRLNIKKEKKTFISFGGNISSAAVNQGFIGIQYNYLAFTPLTFYANTYFGSFYTSGYGLVKVDIPTKLPFQIHGSYSLNKWDYFSNSKILISENTLSYLIQRENYGQVGISFPVSYKGKLNAGGNIGEVRYEYYQDNRFTRFDTADFTYFTNYHAFTSYERNSLNRKQYADRGSYLLLKASYIEGNEKTEPGGSSVSDTISKNEHSWYMFKARLDHYFKPSSKFKLGILLEGAYSTQPFFSNYASTVLSSPSFEPIPESKTVFRSRYRAHQYGAIGIKTILTPVKNFDFRLEGYMFQPLKQINADQKNKAYYDASSVINRYFIGSFTVVYNLSFTQIAVNLNYYDNFGENFPNSSPENYTIMLHLGFILSNPKMLE